MMTSGHICVFLAVESKLKVNGLCCPGYLDGRLCRLEEQVFL